MSHRIQSDHNLGAAAAEARDRAAEPLRPDTYVEVDHNLGAAPAASSSAPSPTKQITPAHPVFINTDVVGRLWHFLEGFSPVPRKDKRPNTVSLQKILETSHVSPTFRDVILALPGPKVPESDTLRLLHVAALGSETAQHLVDSQIEDLLGKKPGETLIGLIRGNFSTPRITEAVKNLYNTKREEHRKKMEEYTKKLFEYTVRMIQEARGYRFRDNLTAPEGMDSKVIDDFLVLALCQRFLQRLGKENPEANETFEIFLVKYLRDNISELDNTHCNLIRCQRLAFEIFLNDEIYAEKVFLEAIELLTYIRQGGRGYAYSSIDAEMKKFTETLESYLVSSFNAGVSGAAGLHKLAQSLTISGEVSLHFKELIEKLSPDEVLKHQDFIAQLERYKQTGISPSARRSAKSILDKIKTRPRIAETSKDEGTQTDD